MYLNATLASDDVENSTSLDRICFNVTLAYDDALNTTSLEENSQSINNDWIHPLGKGFMVFWFLVVAYGNRERLVPFLIGIIQEFVKCVLRIATLPCCLIETIGGIIARIRHRWSKARRVSEPSSLSTRTHDDSQITTEHPQSQQEERRAEISLPTDSDRREQSQNLNEERTAELILTIITEVARIHEDGASPGTTSLPPSYEAVIADQRSQIYVNIVDKVDENFVTENEREREKEESEEGLPTYIQALNLASEEGRLNKLQKCQLHKCDCFI